MIKDEKMLKVMEPLIRAAFDAGFITGRVSSSPEFTGSMAAEDHWKMYWEIFQKKMKEIL